MQHARDKIRDLYYKGSNDPWNYFPLGGKEYA